MKFIYPAVFRKTDKGTYKGFFPDLEDCFGEGETLDEAIEEANAAAYNCFSCWKRVQDLCGSRGSLWNLMRMTASSRLFLMQTTWNLKKAISSGIFL